MTKPKGQNKPTYKNTDWRKPHIYSASPRYENECKCGLRWDNSLHQEDLATKMFESMGIKVEDVTPKNQDNWEKDFDQLFTEEIPVNEEIPLGDWQIIQSEFRAYISELLTSERTRWANELLAKGHGGGNWRRLINQLLTKPETGGA